MSGEELFLTLDMEKLEVQNPIKNIAIQEELEKLRQQPISEVRGSGAAPHNREIGFVSFVRASVCASERSCAGALDNGVPPPARSGELRICSGTFGFC